MGGGCFLEMRWFQRAILQKGLRPVSVYQALMLALAFATFIVALLTFIFTFCA
ncbi:putative holin-like toxin [Levilactobacillus brevis]|uniref:putative holin-like toxin n=1 Tax=Levilactobacillus brevis TaxID=1580 RepID=UPI00345B7D6D